MVRVRKLPYLSEVALCGMYTTIFCDCIMGPYYTTIQRRVNVFQIFVQDTVHSFLTHRWHWENPCLLFVLPSLGLRMRRKKAHQGRAGYYFLGSCLAERAVMREQYFLTDLDQCQLDFLIITIVGSYISLFSREFRFSCHYLRNCSLFRNSTNIPKSFLFPKILRFLKNKISNRFFYYG